KYSSDLSPAFLLNLPYLLIPIWAGVRIFKAKTTAFSLPQVAEEQRKCLHQRPQDVGLVLLLLPTAAFTFFRGLMLIYMFYFLPFLCLCIYGLVLPG
ncbi:PREDICTED: transmembrane 6 superfamily member 2-like, partial [Merops nubicus]|uniref:transmembrane 6 superfamily member 2-like n=1 Tax=Merops nubicus TaxID=57421 RepID=UPI0004F0671F